MSRTHQLATIDHVCSDAACLLRHERPTMPGRRPSGIRPKVSVRPKDLDPVGTKGTWAATLDLVTADLTHDPRAE